MCTFYQALLDLRVPSTAYDYTVVGREGGSQRKRSGIKVIFRIKSEYSIYTKNRSAASRSDTGVHIRKV